MSEPLATMTCCTCPEDLSHYVECQRSEIPAVRRWDVPASYRGQMVERAFAAFTAYEAGPGAPYVRTTDRSVGSGAVTYYRHR